MAEERLETEQILFLGLLQSFISSAWAQLGKRENPLTGKVEVNLEEAKFTIDMLEMLGKKTEGNLTEKEQRILNSALTELKMSYVDSKAKQHPEKDSKDKSTFTNKEQHGYSEEQ
jgi:hypothetical protein